MLELAPLFLALFKTLTLRFSPNCDIASGSEGMSPQVASKETTMRTLLCGVALLAVMTTAGTAADRRVEPQLVPAVAQFSYRPAAMPLLPRQHWNHCGFHDGHYVCADHCGADYQVYYCSSNATGCCHVGLGYCDAAGRLRCAPALF
jgi:hypothetical protein